MIEGYPFQKTKGNRILFGLFLLAVLYLTRDSMPSKTFLSFYTAQFLSLGLMALLSAVFLWKNRGELKAIVTDGRMGMAVLFAVVCLVPMAAKRDWQLMYISVLIAVWLAILVSYFLSCREAAKYYVVLLAALAAYSVIGHLVIRPIAEAGSLPLRIIRNSVDADFYDCLLTFPTLDPETRSRNYGLFREPGVYQYFLILAMYLNNYRVDWKRKYSMWAVNSILAVTMMTTLATGGVIEMGLLAVIVFLDKKWYREKLGRWISIGVVAAGLAVLLVLYIKKPPIYWQLYLMMAKLFSGEDSVVDRLGSLSANMQFFFRSPVFGGKLSDILYAVENNTSSTTLMFAVFGLLGGLLHVVSYVVLVWDRDRFVLWNLGLLAVLMMAINTQNLITNPFFWLFPMLAMVRRVVPAINAKRRMR